jgi:hypothetical protein
VCTPPPFVIPPLHFSAETLVDPSVLQHVRQQGVGEAIRASFVAAVVQQAAFSSALSTTTFARSCRPTFLPPVARLPCMPYEGASLRCGLDLLACVRHWCH